MNKWFAAVLVAGVVYLQGCGSARGSEQEGGTVNTDNVPEELVPFLPVVEKWGAITSDSERYALRDKAEDDPQELKELEDFYNSWTLEHHNAYSKWGENWSLSENKTLARFYFTFMLCDELGFKPPVDENADYVGELIDLLTHVKEGARARAASDLPDYGEEAKRAIPAIREAVNDPAPRVRIWAHYALARIVGESDLHRDAIDQLAESDPDLQQEAERALGWLERTPEEHNLSALCGFCIMNNVRQVRRLAAITDVNGLNHHQQRPLGYAVGNGHKEAVQILLEHGADPNLKDRRGSSELHTAATKRVGAAIITLLIEHGADVNATDRHFMTPLDVAIENGRKSNAQLLRKHGGERGS